MDRIIQSPGKYIQGAGAIKRLGDYLKPLAERWLVVGDKFVLGFAEEMLRKSLADAGLAPEGQRHVGAEQAGVEGHEIHPLPGVLREDGHERIRVQRLHGPARPRLRLIDRDRAEGHGTGA